MSPAPPPGPATTSRPFKAVIVVPDVLPDDAPPPAVMALRELQKASAGTGFVIDADSITDVTDPDAPRLGFVGDDLVTVTGPTAIATVRSYTGVGWKVALPTTAVVQAATEPDGSAFAAVSVPALGRVEVTHPLTTMRLVVDLRDTAGRPVGGGWIAVDDDAIEVIARDQPIAWVRLTVRVDDPDDPGTDGESVGESPTAAR